jgi:hypothetical protein
VARSGFQRGFLLRRRHEAVRLLLSHFVGVISDFDLGDEIGPAACDLVRHPAPCPGCERPRAPVPGQRASPRDGIPSLGGGQFQRRQGRPWCHHDHRSGASGSLVQTPLAAHHPGHRRACRWARSAGQCPRRSARLLLSRRGRERKRLVLPVHGQTLDDGAKSAIDEMPVGPEARHVRARVAAMAHLQPLVARMGPLDGTNSPPFGIDQRAARDGA